MQEVVMLRVLVVDDEEEIHIKSCSDSIIGIS